MQIVSNHPQIEALINGNPQTMKHLYGTIFPKTVSYIKKNNGSYEDSEEIFQDALFQLIARAKIKGVQINGSFDGYIYTVCKNLWLKELNKRKKKVRNDLVFERVDKEEEHVNSILNQERWDLFEEKITMLRKNCKEILKAYFKKMPYKEMVIKFSYANENTAFQRVYKCKKKLMSLIKEDVRYTNIS